MKYTEERIAHEVREFNSLHKGAKASARLFKATLTEIEKEATWMKSWPIMTKNRELFKLISELTSIENMKLLETSLNIVKVNYDRFVRFEDALSDEVAPDILTEDCYVVKTMEEVYDSTIVDIKSILDVYYEVEENKLEVEYQQLINEFKEGLLL